VGFGRAGRGQGSSLAQEACSWPDGEIFYTVAEARVLIERCCEHYSRVRPHSALGYRPQGPEAIAAGPPSASLRAVQQRLADRMTTA
jgi:hypothetical protein